jgi:cobalt-zinc-cadmium efflux system membrane fusion protein
MVPALPDEAIVDFQGQYYVFIADNKKSVSTDPGKGKQAEQIQHYTMVEVNTAGGGSGFTQVSLPDSLQGADIAVKGAYALLSKMKNSEEEEGGH